MLGLQEHTLDFEILPNSSKKILLFLDTSQYFEPADSPLLKINTPGNRRFFQANVDAGKLNVLNSHLIGYSTVLEDETLKDLPDGIWTFTYMICPYEFLNVTKYHLRTSILDCQIDAIYGKIDITSDCDKDMFCLRKDMMDIMILLESAKANARLGKLNKANKDFSLAQKRVASVMAKIYKEYNYAM